MNDYNVEHDALATLEEMRGQSIDVICPKPQRIGVFPNIRLKCCQKGEETNSKDGEEILDIISKTTYGEEAYSPPFFLGSPPMRVSNPLIQDKQFGHEKHVPQFSSSPSSQGLFSPSSPLRKGGYVRMKFGIKSATVRVVGFDCHVPAFA
ncbi:hypothetical protein VNO78_21417 [Psophocarpus tetragonolobus]|uniref:Uncharacterized protein n=1 Tax=Psophocarpus tetragonolobus TaxID=3891 RepID=A0AAN9SGJ7_PSOTE